MKRTILLFLSVITTIIMRAGHVTPEQALQQAQNFLQQTPSGMKRSQAAVPQLKMAGRVGGLYVFNAERNRGFVIVSNDDRTAPILGYSDTGALDPDNMPSNMRAWLQGYTDEIASMDENSSQPASSDYRRVSAVREPIAPLLKTQWNQYEPYWNLCPKTTIVGGEHSLTGCVATAMAQVMNYHQWPKAACTAIPAYDIFDKKNPFHADELPATTFDWDNMLPTYEGVSYTDAQADAVATLMRYCGQSVQMFYGPTLSATDGGFIADALKLYFDYAPDLYYANRIFYGVDEWETLIYNELAGNRPVPYCGRTSEGGHAFVCDGYDGNGLFHINWGWNGDADGYFSLSILNPKHAGAGVIASSMGFCMTQEAIIGIKPSTGGTPDFLPTLFMLGNMTLDGNTVKFAAHSESIVHPNATYEVAMGTKDSDGKLTPVVKAANPYTIEMRFNIDAEISLGNAGLVPGTYHLIPMARCINTGNEPVEGPWHLLSLSERKVQAVVTSDGVTCTLEYLPNLNIEKAYVSNGTSIPHEPNDVALEIKNKGHEYSGEVVVRMWYIGDKTSQEAFADLPPVSALPAGSKTSTYLKQNSTEKLQVSMISSGEQIGNYLVLLYEASSEVLLDTATIAMDKDYEFEFVDLEVVACTASFIPCDDFDWGSFSYELTIKNNDVIDWPKYIKPEEVIIVESDVAGYRHSQRVEIPKGKEVIISNHREVGIESDEGQPAIMYVIQKLGDGRTKELFTAEIQPNGTFVYPTTGINAVTTKQTSGKTYDLQGRIVPDNANISKGIYLKNGKKIIIK